MESQPLEAHELHQHEDGSSKSREILDHEADRSSVTGLLRNRDLSNLDHTLQTILVQTIRFRKNGV